MPYRGGRVHDLIERDEAFRTSLAGTVASIRRLRRDAPRWRPEPALVAVLHSPESLALAWLREALADGPTWPRRFPSHQNQAAPRERALTGLLRRRDVHFVERRRFSVAAGESRTLGQTTLGGNAGSYDATLTLEVNGETYTCSSSDPSTEL